MANFYTQLTDEQIKEHHRKFYDNFKSMFGQAPDSDTVKAVINAIFEEKQHEFIRQSYSDFLPTVVNQFLYSYEATISDHKNAQKRPEAIQRAEETVEKFFKDIEPDVNQAVQQPTEHLNGKGIQKKTRKKKQDNIN